MYNFVCFMAGLIGLGVIADIFLMFLKDSKYSGVNVINFALKSINLTWAIMLITGTII